MSLRIGINADSSTIDGELAVLDELLHVFRDAGFTHAEIPVHGVDCIVHGDLSSERVRDVRMLLQKHSLGYTVHGPDTLDLSDPDYPEIHTAALKAAVDFASEIGAEILVYHGSRRGERETERLTDAARHAERRGVTIAVENLPFSDPRELIGLLDRAGSSALGICLDFGHAFIASRRNGFDFLESVRSVLPRLVHVHIHDNCGIPETAEAAVIDSMFLGAGDLHLPPGWGEIPYGEIFPLLSPVYSGVYMLELRPRFADRYRESVQWVRRMKGG